MTDARHRTAERIVEAIERHCTIRPNGCITEDRWNHDEIRDLVACFIPLTAAEQEEEFKASLDESREQDSHKCSGAFAELRKVMYAEGLSIVTTVRAATEEIKRLR